MPTAATPRINFPCHPKSVTCCTANASINNAGILPREEARTKSNAGTTPTAAAKVTKPEGTKGSRRKEKIRRKASLPFACTSRCALGNRCNCLSAPFLNPFRYNQKETAAPKASPRKEIKVPGQNPKNRILAAVINTLGNMPITAIATFTNRLMNKAAPGLAAKSWSRSSFTPAS